MERRSITEGEIEGKRTANGGFTKKVLKAWGIPWPPPQGWKKRLVKYGYYDATDAAEDGHRELNKEVRQRKGQGPHMKNKKKEGRKWKVKK
jgi:hypothetical protein